MAWLDDIKFDKDGLVPAIAQESATGEVLMLAHANRAALEMTERSGNAHYWSRSRGSLWMKGETSGNVQRVSEIRVDCDGDAVLYRVEQHGAACHTLQHSCFFRAVEENEVAEVGRGGHVLARVDDTIRQRIEQPKDGAYTNYLIDSGIDKILKKLGEESTEVVIAAKNDSALELRAEAADLLFHLLVLLRARNLPVDEVWKELEGRFGRAPRERSINRNRSALE